MQGKDLYDGHSPAQGLTEGISVGSPSTPAAPSVFPDVNLCGGNPYDDAPVGNKAAEAFAGVSADGETGPLVSLADAPEGSEDGSLGATLVGGLGDPPRP